MSEGQAANSAREIAEKELAEPWDQHTEDLARRFLAALDGDSGASTDTTRRPHWFADIDQDQPADQAYRWQPCLETGTGHIPCFDIWFPSKQECEQWIRDVVLGAPLVVDA